METESEHARLKLGNMGPRTSVIMVRISRDVKSPTGWSLGVVAAVDSKARSWGYLVPTLKDNLGQDLIPGLKGSPYDRIAIMSKNQSFKIADTCDSLPDMW